MKNNEKGSWHMKRAILFSIIGGIDGWLSVYFYQKNIYVSFAAFLVVCLVAPTTLIDVIEAAIHFSRAED